MPIPYPQHRTRAREERPSIRTGRSSPVYPANDRYYYGGNPKAQPAVKGLLEPNYFKPPAISYGTPLRKAPPVYTLPDNATGTSYLSLGSTAARTVAKGLVAVQLFDLADRLVTAAIVPAGGVGVPTGGYFTRVCGPFAYPPGGNYSGNPTGVAYSAYFGNIEGAPGLIWGQAISDFQGYGVYAVPAGWNEFGIWQVNHWGDRFAQISAWRRTTSAAAAHNVRPMATNVAAMPSAPPWLDPLASPIGAPYSPLATPYNLIPKLVVNPYRASGAQTVRGYAAPAQAPAARPVAAFNPIGGWRTTVRPIRGAVPRAPVNPFAPSRPKPPGEKVHETKYNPRSKGLAAVVLRGVGAVTEGLDLVDALHKALPKEHRTGYYPLHYRDPKTGEVKVYYKKRHKASAADKISDLVKSPDKVDGAKALSNIVDENIQDAIYGGIGQQVAKARGRARFDETRRYNADRAKQGRQYRKYTKRRNGEDWVDLGPSGRGYQTGPVL